MNARRSTYGILGTFVHHDALMEALHKAIDEQGVEVRDVYSPVPDHHVLELLGKKRSPVRFFTFIGGLLGMVGGLTLALYTSAIWNLIVFGKPVTNVVPFLVVGFEGTILFGALGTFASLLLFARLPFTGFPNKAYRPEFSRDSFGVWLSCAKNKVDDARILMWDAGAIEVEDLGDEATEKKR